MKPYVFLDRDGTINKEVNYLHEIKDFEFEDGCIEGLRLLQEKGYGLVIITNQSGIARGYYSMEDTIIVHNYMTNMLSNHGVWISHIYICPHGPEDHCSCRKPKPGLFLRAARELDIDTENSYVVGDRMRDLAPAAVIHAKCAALRTGHGKTEDFSGISNVYENLLDFAYVAEDVKELANEKGIDYCNGGTVL